MLREVFINKKKKINKKSKNNENEFISKFFRKRTKRLLTNIDILFRKIMIIELISSGIMIMLGILALLFPEISVTIVSIIIGLNIVGIGIIDIYAYKKRNDIKIFKFYLVYGSLAILLGILTILNPFFFSQILTVLLGIYILYLAINKFDIALKLKKIEEKSWTILITSAILEIFISILIFINPFSNLTIIQLIGAFLVLSGIINCMNINLIKNRAIDFMEKL